MEHDVENSEAYDNEPIHKETPTTSCFTSFDVNKFLKKTFSDYDLDRQNGLVDHYPSISSNHSDRLGPKPISCQTVLLNQPTTSQPKRKQQQRQRAGSVPTSNGDGNPTKTIVHTFLENEHPFDNEQLGQLNNDEISSRRGRSRDRQARGSQFCAYCGNEFLSRGSSDAYRNLYCPACKNFFTRHTPAELQRLIAHDEMTRPTMMPTSRIQNLNEAGTSSTAIEDKEISPLLTQSESNKVVLISDFDHERNDDLSMGEYGQPRQEEENSHRHYEKNGRPHDRSYGDRLLRKVKPVTTSITYHGQQQQFHSRRIQPMVSSGGTSTYIGETSTIGVWSRDHSNSRRSSFTSASSMTRPTCRICHLHGESGNTLFSPCRCAGTMQYVHTSCLMHWLEISTKKVLPSPHCELCGYQYRTHHCYKFHRMHAPSCNHRDRLLHVIFVLMLLVMIACGALSAFYLRQDKGSNYKRVTLNADDVIVITSALLFFCAFFVAVFTQYRAETSVCRLCLRCWLINRHWRIKNYDRNLDYERDSKFGRSSVLIEQV